MRARTFRKIRGKEKSQTNKKLKNKITYDSRT